jgi:hypothetical protein
VGSFVLTSGVIGTLWGAYYQACAWSYQDQVARFQKDAAAIEQALADLDKHLDEEWVVASELDEALGQDAEVVGDGIQKLADKFESVDAAWRTQHKTLSAEFEVSVDTKFFESEFFIKQYPGRLALINDSSDIARSRCESYALGGQQPNGDDPLSVGILLEISYHCHDLIRQGIERRLHAHDADGSQARSQPDSTNPGLELSHSYWVDMALQCMVVQRDLEIRGRSPVVSWIPLPTDGVYQPTKAERSMERACVTPYKEHPCLGASPSDPQCLLADAAAALAETVAVSGATDMFR